MAVPKKKTSKAKSRSRRASAWVLDAAGAEPLPAVPARQAAPRRLPELRLVQGPPGDRGQLTLPVAVDAMGGDKAPGEIVAGALPAHEQLGIPVVLVGPTTARSATPATSRSSPASEVIGDGRGPGARGPHEEGLDPRASPPRRCATARPRRWSRAGNTGATMAAALLRMGRISGVARPAIATPLPVPGGTPDGADRRRRERRVPGRVARAVRPDGRAPTSTSRYGNRRPVGRAVVDRRGGLEGQHARERGARAASPPASGVRFIGNVEGRDLLAGRADVVVTDGFTGNVALKALEGALAVVHGHPRRGDRLDAGDQGRRRRARSRRSCRTRRTSTRKRPAGRCCSASTASASSATAARRRGRSSNAVRVAHDMAERDLVGHVRAAVSR